MLGFCLLLEYGRIRLERDNTQCLLGSCSLCALLMILSRNYDVGVRDYGQSLMQRWILRTAQVHERKKNML